VEAHEVAHDAARDEARPGLVADLGRAAGHRFVLPYASPLAREHPDANLGGEVAQLRAGVREVAGLVVVHRAARHAEQTLLRDREPVRERERRERIAPQSGAQPVRERSHRDVMGDRHVVPTERDRPTAVPRG
jgi:hypothetical protein